MNLRNWSKEHTKGLILGLLTIGVGIFIIIWFFSLKNGLSYAENFHRFTFLHEFTAKVISLAALGNLPWFHFLSLKRGNWALGQGVIIATVIDLLIMILFKFIL